MPRPRRSPAAARLSDADFCRHCGAPWCRAGFGGAASLGSPDPAPTAPAPERARRRTREEVDAEEWARRLEDED